MTTSAEPKDTLVLFKSRAGPDLRATPLRLGRFAAVFELCGPPDLVRLSEALDCFRIAALGRTLYMGRAVVRGLVDTGPTLVCEVALDETAWQDVVFDPALLRDGRLVAQFDEFLGEWQKAYQVRPEYKVIVADMQTFFGGLRMWLQQVALGIDQHPESDRSHLEHAATAAIARKVLPCISALFERFERFTATLPEEVLPVHRSYMRRQLHPLVLCSPFAYRTFIKPLGYAGDYEMVNMIVRNGWEGDSLFAKVVNTWFLRQPPAQAHRNRIAYLADRLREETTRVHQAGRLARIFNLACGPAHEVQQFLRDSPASESAALTLLDFNRETLQHLQSALARARAEAGRTTSLTYVQKSVHHLLKESSRTDRRPPGEAYDFVYCAGLFDYLSDQVCRRLLEVMHDWLAPGGLLVATNVEPSNPLRHGMEHLLDWHLIYRSGPDMLRLLPEKVHREDARVLTEATGTNVFLEVRKPVHG